MSKYHKISWRKSDEDELKRVVRNYNAKIKRLAKKNPQIENVLPEKVSVAQMKELINTRQDLKRELNSLKRFSKRGAEEIVDVPGTDYNLKITKWQKSEMNRRVAVINRRRAKRLEDITNMEMKSRGEALGYTRGELGMGKAEEISLRPMNAFTRRMSQSDLKWKWKSILKESKSDFFTESDYRLRDNYIKGIKENYDYENVKDIIKQIEGMDIKEFLNVFNAEGGTFEFASPDGRLNLKHAEYKGYETALRSIWIPER